MKLYEGLIRVNQRLQKVQVQASNPYDAKQQLIGQYGSNSVIGTPYPI